MRRPGAGHAQGISVSFDVSLSATDAAPSQARAALAPWLDQETPGAITRELVLLLVSELVTNCVRHAAITDDEPLLVRASRTDDTVRIEVWDNGTEGVVERREATSDVAPGGFGLNLVARVSGAWGVHQDAHGTTVWLELARRQPAAARADAIARSAARGGPGSRRTLL